ncbi:gtf-2F1, partial [Pristionchus pacificus]
KRVMAKNPGNSEFVVKVPELNDMKRFTVLKFNNSIKIDPTTWANPECDIRMEREENRVLTSGLAAVQDFGEGTEYGKAAREEARRKKLGRRANQYSIDKQPWRMKINEADGKEKKLHSIREAAGTHADYWLFLKNGEEFHAYKVDDWHGFVPAITHKTLDIDEAEEEFTKRNRVMNQFALRAQILDKMKQKEADEEEEQKKGRKSGLMIKDEHSSSGSEGDDEKDEDGEEKKKKKVKKGAKPRKDKRVKVENSDEVAKYESEDGEDEGREYDYMSDSGSDSDRDIPMEDKVEKALVGVAEEEGLKKLMESDDSSEDDEDDPEKKLLNRKDDDDKKRRIDIEERDSSGSDSEVDDLDKDKLDSVILMPKKGGIMDGGAGTSTGIKRPADDTPKGPEVKKVKEEKEEGLTEEMVRKLLRTKPYTTKELLTKIKARCGGELPKAEMVTKLAAILKAIEPQQFKQKQGRKDVLFFSLSNTI